MNYMNNNYINFIEHAMIELCNIKSTTFMPSRLT